ncbi:MAG: type II toxin-antitoxin system RelE/ParE family toxin [Vicinamibacteria bacterium]
MDKPLFWLGSSGDDVRAFPAQARRNVGFQLRRVQQGLQPTDWKWMPAVGTGVQEIRIHAGTEYRVFYVARFTEGVYVLHAFEKPTRKTPKRDIEQARNRYRDVLKSTREKEHGKT